MNRFQRISAQQARELIAAGNVHIVDVRDSVSFTQGHIAGAQLLDAHNIDQFIDTAAKDIPVLVYCYHGNSSQGAADYLVEKGFHCAYSLDGGYDGYNAI